MYHDILYHYPYLERRVPLERASGGAGDGGTGGDGLRRGRGWEKLFKNLAVQISLERDDQSISEQETHN